MFFKKSSNKLTIIPQVELPQETNENLDLSQDRNVRGEEGSNLNDNVIKNVNLDSRNSENYYTTRVGRQIKKPVRFKDYM